MVHAICRIVLILATIAAASAAAQQSPARRLPGAASEEELTLLVNGFAFLAQGDHAQALQKATEARSRFPKSLAVLAFALEVDIARGGAKAGLDLYESWLAGRTLEEPAMLRRVAIASLREFAGQTQDGLSRDAALWALADDGDAEAAEEVRRAALAVETGAIRRLAERGDEGAIKSILSNKGPWPNAQATIMSLGESRSPLVIEPLTRKLTDPEPGIRGVAAEALAKAGGRSVIPRLRPLLNDSNAFVRSSAAGALFQLNDSSGMQLLEELAAADEPAGRLRAAYLMSSRPDAAWQGLVRGLLADGTSKTRLEAAELLLGHDPATARGVLDQLAGDANPVIRERATRKLASDPEAPFATLRRFLRDPDWLTRVHAAASIAARTRS